MKVGINLIGVSKDIDGSKRNINWVYAFYRIKQRVIECWLDQGHDVKIYITTYNHNDFPNMIRAYKNFDGYGVEHPADSIKIPVKYQIIEDLNTPRLLTQKIGHEFLRNEDLDIIVDTRFEVIFNKNITDYRIDYNKFNVLFKEKNAWDKQLTCDMLFIYPYYMLEDYISLCEENHRNLPLGYGGDMHNFYYRIKEKRGEDSVNFMTDDICYSFNDKTNYHYHVIRTGYGNLL